MGRAAAAAGSKLARSLVVVPLFFALNAALSLLNRWTLDPARYAFPAPLLLTAAHQLFAFLCLLPPMAATRARRARLAADARRDWRGVVAVGAALSANIALNNSSLAHISLPLNQVIRAAIPLVTAAAAALAERAAPPGDEAAALLLLCGGVGVAISEGAGGGGARGVSLAAASVLAGAAQLTLQGRALAGRLDALSLALLTAPVTAACLAAPAWATERAAAAAFFAADGARAAGVLGAGAAAALAYNVVHNELVGLAGPVAACVLGQVKIVALMALSAAVLGEGRDFSPRMSAGCAAAIAGFGLYTWARVRRQAAPAGAARRGAALRRGSSAGAAKSPRTPASRAVQLRLEIPAPAGDLPGLMTPGSSAARRTPSARRARTPAGAV